MAQTVSLPQIKYMVLPEIRMLGMESLRQFRAEGNQIVDLVNDLIFQSKITQSEIAYQTGKSEAQISLILNPLHCSQWTLTDLPVLMRLLNGEAIARVICGWLKMHPIENPTSTPNHNQILGVFGDAMKTVSDAVEDGVLTFKEVQKIKEKVAILNGRLDTLTESMVREL